MSDREILKRTAMVILNYRSPDLTISAARHLLDFGTGLRIVLVDNCSGDGSKERFEKEFFGNASVHLVCNEDNRGYAHGNNVGIEYAQSLGDIDFVGIMNPDVVADADVIARLADTLEKQEEIGLITAETYYNGVYRYAPSYYEGKSIAPVEVVQGCFFLARLSTLCEIGKMDEATFLYYEEDILGAKLKARGLQGAVLVGNYIRHNHHEKDKSLQRRASKIFDMTCLHRSRRHYIQKYLSCHAMVKSLLLLFLDIDFEIRKLGVRVLIKK